MTVVGLGDWPAPSSLAGPDYPRNAWYAAAWDVEVSRTLISRTACGEPLAIYRTQDGRPVALQDVCWHRLFPLSKGHLRGDDVFCGYHGLEYDPQGRCIYVPSQETINPAAVVRSYPAVEQHRFVWVWPGDPARADPDQIPQHAVPG